MTAEPGVYRRRTPAGITADRIGDALRDPKINGLLTAAERDMGSQFRHALEQIAGGQR